MSLAEKIRDVPDFPEVGILFRDITTLLKDATSFRQSIDDLARRFEGERIDKVVAAESRGFIFGAPLAYLLGAGFVPARKLGRLPAKTIRAEYKLEYGANTVEMHTDAIAPGERVLVVDDLLATGGTVTATVDLVQRLGGEIVGLAFLVELEYTGGRQLLNGYRIETLVTYAAPE